MDNTKLSKKALFDECKRLGNKAKKLQAELEAKQLAMNNIAKELKEILGLLAS